MKFEFEQTELNLIEKLKNDGKHDECMEMICPPDRKHVVVTLEITDNCKAEAFILSLFSSVKTKQNNEAIGCSISEIHFGEMMHTSYMENAINNLRCLANEFEKELNKRK